MFNYAEGMYPEDQMEGFLDGMVAGELIGWLEGFRKGEIKGKLDTIAMLLIAGVDSSVITAATGIDLLQFRALRKKLVQSTSRSQKDDVPSSESL